MLNRLTIAALMIVAASASITVSAQTPESARVAVCATPYPVIASASTGTGYINFCVYYPESVQPGETFNVGSILTAPTTVLPVFLTAAQAFTANSGCVEGAPAVGVPTANGVVGTMWSATTTFTMNAGSEKCDFSASAALTVAAVPLQIYSTGVYVQVRTENVRVDNFNYLCDAPGIAPTAYNPSTVICDDLATGTTTVNVNNTIANNVTINGNFTLNGTVDGSNQPQGFNGSLYILLAAIGLALARTGEIRGNHGYRMIAGGIFLIAPLAIMKELERLGFNHMDNTNMKFALAFFAINWILAIYLFFPKDEEETTK